jgi:hypothetical protein
MCLPIWKFPVAGARSVLPFGRRLSLVFALALSPAAGGSALADSYRVAERSLILDPPASYCLIDRSVKAEAELYRFMVETNADLNRVLAVFVDCAELQRWRAGELSLLERYGNILTPIEETAYPGVTRSAFLAELRKAMDWALPLGIAAGQARIEATVPELNVGQSESLGVIEADEAALYGGIAQRLEYEGRSFVLPTRADPLPGRPCRLPFGLDYGRGFEHPAQNGEDEGRAHAEQDDAVSRFEAAQQLPPFVQGDVAVTQCREGDSREVERALHGVELAEPEIERSPAPDFGRMQNEDPNDGQDQNERHPGEPGRLYRRYASRLQHSYGRDQPRGMNHHGQGDHQTADRYLSAKQGLRSFLD